jgi:hypothetical protein
MGHHWLTQQATAKATIGCSGIKDCEIGSDGKFHQFYRKQNVKYIARKCANTGR